MSDTPKEKEMNEGRRESDHRFKDIESTIKTIGTSVSDIRAKIYNGFEDKIKYTREMVDIIDKQNEKDHKLLSDGMIALGKKLDKILWTFVSISFLAIAGFIIKYLLENIPL